jgi:acetylornithine deacetylase/succinyl-diaminopimelate desuccinylase-like protein
MSQIKTDLDKYFNENKSELLKDFYTLLSFKSISTDSNFKSEIISCADWINNYLHSIDFNSEVIETDGHPCVYAERIVSDQVPTVLFYTHYDVQPVDPIELWESPPFTPTERNGEIYARGAIDDKGQLFYVLACLKGLKDKLPHVNIKIIVEGEEEIGSKSLPKLLEDNKEKFKADYLLIADCGFHSLEHPAVTLGCRGMITMELSITESNTDLHSGEHGGIAYNPIHALVELLESLRSKETGKILVPGFYDEVIDLTIEEKKDLQMLINEVQYEQMFGAPPIGGEKGIPFLESAWLRPTIEVNGINGGYTGEGFKTVIPKTASCKLSSRLVPAQNPEKIASLIKKHLESKIPKGLTLSLNIISDSGWPIRLSPNSKLAQITKEAYEEAMDKPCGFILCGGSIPISRELANLTGAEPVFLGFGLPGDNLHAPNEHFGIDRIRLGMMTIGVLLNKLS